MVTPIFFIKFLVLALSLDQEAPSAREGRRMGRYVNRRSTDGDSGGNVVLSWDMLVADGFMSVASRQYLTGTSNPSEPIRWRALDRWIVTYTRA